MTKAVYAGSFDPPTNGHLWLIEQGSKLFTELVVSIGVNPAKTYTFSIETRLEMLSQLTQHLPNVTIDNFENKFLVQYAKEIGAEYILRGIRDVAGYEFERGIRHINHDLEPDVDTVFLMPPRMISEISSSLVKGLVGPKGWESVVSRYVSEHVLDALKEHHENQH